MRVVVIITSLCVLAAGALLFTRPVTPVAPRPPEAAVGPTPEMILAYMRETFIHEQMIQEAETEMCCQVNRHELLDALQRDLKERKFRYASIEHRGRAWRAAWSYDVSLDTDWQGLRSLLAAYAFDWKKMLLVKDLRILRVADDRLTVSFVLMAIAIPTQFAAAVVNRP